MRSALARSACASPRADCAERRVERATAWRAARPRERSGASRRRDRTRAWSGAPRGAPRRARRGSRAGHAPAARDDRRRARAPRRWRATCAVFVVAAVVVDRGARDVAQAQLSVAERAARARRAPARRRATPQCAQALTLAVFDALRELDLALAGEERHARELLEVRRNRVGRGIVAAGRRLKGKGSCHYRLVGEYGASGTVRSSPSRNA